MDAPKRLGTELAAVDDMLAIAERYARPTRGSLADRLDQSNLLDGENWNRRRLIIFTEYEDTRRWLERRLREAMADTDRAEDRIGVFTGAPARIDAKRLNEPSTPIPMWSRCASSSAPTRRREGINLQTYCSDLIHFDLPWNPSRLEQRNGRIDRKLQPAKQIICRYFRYEQREADIVLEALVRKTETIREQLGSVGQVIEDRITKRLAEGGICAARERRSLALSRRKATRIA